MNYKFKIKKEHLDKKIITKDSSGQDVLVTAETFNDYYAELMFASGQGFLIETNAQYDANLDEKKSFNQVSPNVIALTYDPMESVGNEQLEIALPQESKSKGGKQRKAKK